MRSSEDTASKSNRPPDERSMRSRRNCCPKAVGIHSRLTQSSTAVCTRVSATTMPHAGPRLSRLGRLSVNHPTSSSAWIPDDPRTAETALCDATAENPTVTRQQFLDIQDKAKIHAAIAKLCGMVLQNHAYDHGRSVRSFNQRWSP